MEYIIGNAVFLTLLEKRMLTPWEYEKCCEALKRKQGGGRQ